MSKTTQQFNDQFNSAIIILGSSKTYFKDISVAQHFKTVIWYTTSIKWD